MNRGGMQAGARGGGPEGMGHDPRRADPRGGGFDRGEPQGLGGQGGLGGPGGPGGPGGLRSGDPRMAGIQDRPLPSAAVSRYLRSE